MEVGAVKQAFNNEVILLKKNLNQAKIQVIHKLTRKSKTLSEKKCPDKLKEKLQRKAESAVSEVLLIKKIKTKDVAKFALTHKGELNNYLNRPVVDEDKACARLLLHKPLQEKYRLLRNKFGGIPIADLFMSRAERRKLKKETRANKKIEKTKDKSVTNKRLANFSQEDMDLSDEKDLSDDDSDDAQDIKVVNSSDSENEQSDVESNTSNNNIENEDSNDLDFDAEVDSGNSHSEKDEHSNDNCYDAEVDVGNTQSEKDEHSNNDNQHNESENILKKTFIAAETETSIKTNTINTPNKIMVKQNKKTKINKAKNLKDKILNRKFKKSDDSPEKVNKVVDPFFVTATGDNYLSVVEQRAPDEVKEEHKQGNRKLRRAVMFGHAPRMKQRKDNFRDGNFKQNNYERSNSDTKHKINSFSDDNKSFGSKFVKPDQPKPEKLHPSWEAKKKQSGILPFKGKKIVFDDS